MFKALFVLIVAALSISLSHAKVLRLSEPITSDEVSETFGAKISDQMTGLALETVLSSPEEHLQSEIMVEAKVAQVCQKKGCFLIAYEGEHSVRVSFKDYSFFVPTDLAGQQVTLVGQLVERDLSPGQAEHYSKDLGESGRVVSGKVFELVATSVRVPLS